MGLLDDAIREHLELKRLHGADPDEVAREERAALDPVRDEHGAEPGEHLEYPEELEEEIPPGEDHASSADDPEDSRDGRDFDADDPPELESRHAIQETAEIDMRTILEAEDLAEDTPASTLDDREPPATQATPARAHRSLLRRRRRTGGEADPL
jgi:hypothetical protein